MVGNRCYSFSRLHDILKENKGWTLYQNCPGGLIWLQKTSRFREMGGGGDGWGLIVGENCIALSLKKIIS